MKALATLTIVTASLIGSLHAWEPVVNYAVQALTGLAGDTPRFDRVYCHDSRFLGRESAFSLICAPNIPPTNGDEKLEDHNLLSTAGVKITASLDKHDVMNIVLDITSLRLSTPLYEGPAEDLVGYALECIRLTAKISSVSTYAVEIRCSKDHEALAAKLGKDFKTHDKEKPFVRHPAEAKNE